MAQLTVQKPVLSTSGTALTLGSATTAGDYWVNTGSQFVHVVNNNAAARTITFDSPGTCSFNLANNNAHDLALVVPPVGSAPLNRVQVGPFPTVRFNDGNGRVNITVDEASGVTLAVQALQ